MAEDSAAIPTDANGNLQAMDGVILDPAGSSAFEVPTTAGSVLLPAAPGTPGFSPIVRLHDFRIPSGATACNNGPCALGFFTGVCPIGQTAPCPTTSVDLSKLSANAFNSMFIVASPQ